MKKIMMIAALMVATVSAKAQFEPGTFSIQPKIGGVVSSITNAPSINFGAEDGFQKDFKMDNTAIAGFTIGGELEYQISKHFSLAAGLGYSLQGSGWEDYKYKEGDEKFEIKDLKIELGYVTAPILANIYLFKGFAIKTGVQFGYLTNAHQKGTIEMSDKGWSTKSNESIDVKDMCNKWDISIPVGVSYQVPTIPIVIDGRLNLGLTDIFKKDVLESGQKNCQNVVFQLTVGYKFKL